MILKASKMGFEKEKPPSAVMVNIVAFGLNIILCEGLWGGGKLFLNIYISMVIFRF